MEHLRFDSVMPRTAVKSLSWRVQIGQKSIGEPSVGFLKDSS